MIEHIFKSEKLAAIIILNNPNISCYFLVKYVCKINWARVFKNVNKHKSIIFFLRKNFKFEDFKDNYLFLMSKKLHLKIVKILIEKGVNIHVKADYALNWAAAKGQLKVVKFLLEKGAYIHPGYNNAFKMAIDNEHLKVVRLFLEKLVNFHQIDYFIISTCKNRPCKDGNLKVFRLLLKRGNIDLFGENALIQASINGHSQFVKILLENGANIYVKNGEALRWAYRRRHHEIINILKNKIINN